MRPVNTRVRCLFGARDPSWLGLRTKGAAGGGGEIDHVRGQPGRVGRGPPNTCLQEPD